MDEKLRRQVGEKLFEDLVVSLQRDLGISEKKARSLARQLQAMAKESVKK